ncbi:hypothetical protein HK101_011914 [Irineochytrium annulatum]|nr:hypothetical protein HK101_011914 [Irineochytrium annulatum]
MPAKDALLNQRQHSRHLSSVRTSLEDLLITGDALVAGERSFTDAIQRSPPQQPAPLLATPLVAPPSSTRATAASPTSSTVGTNIISIQPSSSPTRDRSGSFVKRVEEETDLCSDRNFLKTRRMSSHVTLANTSVGLREIAKQIGKVVLKWESPPRSVMIVTKVHDPELVTVTRGFSQWLLSRGMTVYVEERLKAEPAFGYRDDGGFFDVADDDEEEFAEEFIPGETGIPPITSNPTASLAPHVSSGADSPSSEASTASSFASSNLSSAHRPHSTGGPTCTRFSSSTAPIRTVPTTPTNATGALPLVVNSDNLRFWTPETCEQECSTSVDLIVTLGGDGTVLFTASLFQTSRVPPILPFDLGSLGFLAVFDYASHRQSIMNVLEGPEGFAVNMRMRLACTVVRAAPRPGELERETFHVLNELVVDRGPSPYMSQLELFVDDNHLTTMQADGLVVATPTGSTAYSLSANGSLVHPAVNTILVTPICPHTLSFRPMLLPDSIELKVCLPRGSRTATASASFDGRRRTELRQGDVISVALSRHPIPTVCSASQVLQIL